MADFEAIVKKKGCKIIKTLSRKAESGVYVAESTQYGSFVMRIYTDKPAAYNLLPECACEGIPQLYECGFDEENRCFFVCEEFIDGVSLQEMLDGGEVMQVRRATQIVKEVCKILCSLHDNGLIHRDVKPEHVILTPENKVYLIDYDAAMVESREKTKDTMLLGTAIYAAPEQFGLTRSDTRTDIYAVGILYNILLTGQHPAVVRFKKGTAGRVISKCTEMNPEDRYQNMTELMLALPSEREKTKKTKKVLTILAAIAVLAGCTTAALRFQQTPAVTLDDVQNVETDYLICMQTDKGNFEVLQTGFDDVINWEKPTLFFLAEHESRTFYFLSKDDGEELTLPLLDCDMQPTGEYAGLKAKKIGDANVSGVNYSAWQVKVPKAYEGAERMGFAIDGDEAAYSVNGEEKKPKCMWLLDETFEDASFVVGHDKRIIPCAGNPAGGKYSDKEMLLEAAGDIGDPQESYLHKTINMSLEPGAEENAIYLVHTEDTTVNDESYDLHAYDYDGGSLGTEGKNGGVFRQRLGSVYKYEDAGTTVVGGVTMQVTKVSLKKYYGHDDIQTSFFLTSSRGSREEGYARIVLGMGMNIVIKGDAAEPDDFEITDILHILEKALGFEATGKPLEFRKTEDGYTAFYPQACAFVTEQGQGREISLAMQIGGGLEIASVTDIQGNPIAYAAANGTYYILLDETGKEIYDDAEILQRGWHNGMSGTRVGDSAVRHAISVQEFFDVDAADYMSKAEMPQAGGGNAGRLREFLGGNNPDGKKYKVRKGAEYKVYNLFFDETKDAMQNAIVFTLSKG